MSFRQAVIPRLALSFDVFEGGVGMREKNPAEERSSSSSTSISRLKSTAFYEIALIISAHRSYLIGQLSSHGQRRLDRRHEARAYSAQTTIGRVRLVWMLEDDESSCALIGRRGVGMEGQGCGERGSGRR